MSGAIREGFDTAKTFLQEAWAELHKITWPAPKEIQAATWVVLLVVAIIALFLFLVDTALSWLLRIFLGN